MPLPCDALLPGAPLVLHRAVSVQAPAPLVYRWLCQLRAAPYSYDLLDNFGRRSPQQLTPGLERLAAGQRVMTIFRLAEFEPDVHVTLWNRGRMLGPVAVTYAVVPERGAGTRLLLRIRWSPRAVPLAREALATAFALGDLAMARRQLANLATLAERDAAYDPAPNQARTSPALRSGGKTG
jgi:hypothetical protein